MGLKAVLLGSLAAIAVVHVAWWTWHACGTGTPNRPSAGQLGIGFGTNFFDTLGIGSFAPTTALFKLGKVVPDELIPGTMNVGHTAPVIVQAFIFMVVVEVDPLTLAALVTASAVGAWLGAGVVSGLPRRTIQLGMAVALGAAAAFLAMTNMGWFPAGGEAIGLMGWRLWLAAGVNAVLGALNTLGIGLYAPCMVLISLLGMNPRAAFPIMMGSCAFLMPVGGLRFIRRGRYDMRAALGLAIGGVPAVLIAAFIVKALPVETLRWLVVAVVLYTAVAMLRSANQGAVSEQAAGESGPVS